jgi:hypothetical protein
VRLGDEDVTAVHGNLKTPTIRVRPLTPKQLIALHLASADKLRPGELRLGDRAFVTWSHDSIDYAPQVAALRRKRLILYRAYGFALTPAGEAAITVLDVSENTTSESAEGLPDRRRALHRGS